MLGNNIMSLLTKKKHVKIFEILWVLRNSKIIIFIEKKM